MQAGRWIALGVFVVVFGYLAFWPVPVDPEAWDPPEAPPLEGVYAPNAYLAGIERIDLPASYGPEDVAVDGLGRIYAGLADGRILRMSNDASTVETFAETGGRPLGLDFDAEGNLYVADAKRGLIRYAPDGARAILSTEAGGVPFGFTDDVDVAPDGKVYFSDASYKFGIEDYVLDLVENRPNGRLLEYDPATGATRVLLDDLYFANGVAVSPDGAFVLVNETARYRVRRYWLAGPKAGTSDFFVENLPAFPDGISSDGAGTYWVALVSPRNPVVDALGPWPSLRKVLVRLPEFLQPAPKRFAFVLGLDAEGRVVHNLQDPAAERLATISSVERYGEMLYFGSLEEPALGRIEAPQ